MVRARLQLQVLKPGGPSRRTMWTPSRPEMNGAGGIVNP